VNKQEFSASSWRSNEGYTKMHSQPIIKTLIKGSCTRTCYVGWCYSSAFVVESVFIVASW